MVDAKRVEAADLQRIKNKEGKEAKAVERYQHAGRYYKQADYQDVKLGRVMAEVSAASAALLTANTQLDTEHALKQLQESKRKAQSVVVQIAEKNENKAKEEAMKKAIEDANRLVDIQVADSVDGTCAKKCSHHIIFKYASGRCDDRGVVSGYEAYHLFKNNNIDQSNPWRRHFFAQASANTRKKQARYKTSRSKRKAEEDEQKQSASKKQKTTGESESSTAVTTSTTVVSSTALTTSPLLPPPPPPKARPRTPPKKKKQTAKQLGGPGGHRLLDSKNRKRAKPTRENEENKPTELECRNRVYKTTGFAGPTPADMKEALFGSYTPKSFPTASFCLLWPSVTISASKTGERSAAGARTDDDGLIAAALLEFRIQQKFKVPFVIKNAGSVNMATSMYLGWKIDLWKLIALITGYGLSSTYDPDNFKGIHWTLAGFPGVVLVFFKSGAVNIVGLKTDEHFRIAKARLVPWIKAQRERIALIAEKEGEQVEEPLGQPLPDTLVSASASSSSSSSSGSSDLLKVPVAN